MRFLPRFAGTAAALACAVSLAACGPAEIAEPPVRATPISSSPSSASSESSEASAPSPQTVTETFSEAASASASAAAAPGVPAPQPDGVITVAGLGEAGEEAAYPACDGRAILILDSVVDEGNGGAAMPDIARQVLMAHPSGKPVQFTVPGACPSLRAQLDGQNIYPVYLDYGADVNAMCRAKATYGGNGRILSNAAEYVDPC